MPSVDSGGSEKRSFTSTFRDKGIRGIVAGTPGSVGSKLAEIWRGKEKPEDENAPKLEDFRDLLTNKNSLVDEHGLRVPEAKRKRFKTKLEEEIRPDMIRMWRTHIESIKKVYETNPGFFLQDKTSYAYHQLLQCKQFLNTTTDPSVLGGINQEKLNAYFATSAGYTETMRYFETEAYRLQCANDIIAVTKNGYSPDTLKGVNIGLSTADITLLRTSLALRFGSDVALGVALNYFIYVTGIVGTIAALTPNILAVLPWTIPGAVGGAILSRQHVEALFTKNSPQQIMQMCHGMFAAIQGTGYVTECEYLREMYGIDPRELRIANVNPPVWTIDAKSTTGGWKDSRSNILEIKNLRRRLYVDAMGIEERDMYGVPEEAFIDAQGNFRTRILPEGGGVKYQKEIWNRFYRLGGYQTIDASGAVVDLSPLEAMQRFHKARLELTMEAAEKNAQSILATERQSQLTIQENKITTRVTAIDVTAAEEKKTLTHDATLYDELNTGVGGKEGLSTYLSEWKGAATGSMEERLKGISSVRKDVYDEISLVIQYKGTVDAISEKDIDAAIAELKKDLDPLAAGPPPSVGYTFAQVEALYGSTDPTIDDTTRPRKGGGYEQKDNPKYKVVEAQYQDAKTKKEEIEAQIRRLDKDLKMKLANELAKHQPAHEHSKAHEDVLKKMSEAYTKLSAAMATRVPPVGAHTSVASFDILIGGYPGNFVVDVPNPAPPPAPPLIPETRSGVEGLTRTLGSETKLWRDDENDMQERRMTILYAVAWKRAKDEVAALDAAQGAGTYATVAGTAIKFTDFWSAAQTTGKLSEMSVLAHNAGELSGMGIVVVGGSNVDMNGGDNAGLKAYIKARQEAYSAPVEELIQLHERRKQVAEAGKTKVDEKYRKTKDRYTAVQEWIRTEKGGDVSRQVSAQVRIHGLTGDAAVVKLTDLRDFPTRPKLERDAYADYEQAFMLRHTDFPPAMLEFLNVLFNYRTDAKGKEMLDNIFEILTEVVPVGTGLRPHEMLADFIYQATPGIQDVIKVPRANVIGNLNPATNAPFAPRYNWEDVVIEAFGMRQLGSLNPPLTPDKAQYFNACVPHHYSATEMNGILLSIHQQIIQKVVNNGVI